MAVRKLSRSSGAFMDALAELVHEKPLEHLFTAEIIRLSGYSKSAFYNSFTDKYDLSDRLVQYETDVVTDFLLAYAYLNRGSREKEARTTQSHFFAHVYRHKVRYEALLDGCLSSVSPDDWCMRIIEQCLAAFPADSTQGPSADTDVNMYLFARLNTVFGLIRYWRRIGYRCTPEHMAEQCSRLS